MTTNPPIRPRRAVHRFAAVFTIVAVAVAGTVVAAAPASAAQRYDADIGATIADIQAYWSKTMPEVYGARYDAIPDSRLFPYSADNPPPGCGTETVPYQEVAGNAFYCQEGDFVAWDTQQLMPKLREQYGDFAPALVLAHEWGHAIQARVGFDAYQTVDFEQQADCFAGAWTAHVAHGDSDLHLSDADLDTALAGLLQLRDPSGVDGSEDGAHGNGFDRVRAFQDGVEGGADTCAAYANNPPRVTEAAYTSQADYMNGGDMSLTEVLPAVTDSLTSYWETTPPKVVAFDGNAPSCDGATDGGVLVDSVVYCPSTNTIAYDRATMQRAHDEIGDFAAGVLLAAAWSSSVQHANHDTVGTTSARKTAECLAGAYTATLDASTSRSSARSEGITLSPGDLDEVVSMLVAAGSGDHRIDRGTAFNRVAAFRTGFFKGTTAC
jgi:predicted metalloprotease